MKPQTESDLPAPTAKETSLNMPPIESDYPDMRIWRQELRKKIKELAGASKNNPEILKYFTAVDLSRAMESVDETPWCATVESWVLIQAGYKSPRTASALAFATYGIAVSRTDCQYGDIVVRKRTGGGHVHRFVAHDQSGGYWALGGNQNNEISIGLYSWTGVVAVRRPDRGAVKPIPAQEAGSLETLQIGSSGPAVEELQRRLNELGANPQLVVDGRFGAKTENAVKAFQRSVGLQGLGMVGPKTNAALAAAQAPEIPAPAPAPATDVKLVKRSMPWDGKHPDAEKWTTTLLFEIGSSKLPDIVPQGIENFCKRYAVLSRADRIFFWASLVAIMTKFESSYNPTSRMIETSMGTDPLTGRQVASEGLLQLSYQDVKNYKSILADVGIDWEKDKALGDKDPRKTIFDAHKNLTAGVRILAHLVNKHGRIDGKVDGKWKGASAYWAVIREGRPSYVSIRNYCLGLKFS